MSAPTQPQSERPGEPQRIALARAYEVINWLADEPSGPAEGMVSEPEDWAERDRHNAAAPAHFGDTLAAARAFAASLAKPDAQGAARPAARAEPVTLPYTNWRGETAERTISPTGRVLFTSNEWHPNPQWFLEAMDARSNEVRLFALSGFARVQQPAAGAEANDVDLVEAFGRAVAARAKSLDPTLFGGIIAERRTIYDRTRDALLRRLADQQDEIERLRRNRTVGIENLQGAFSGLRMVRETVENFGSIASLESEEVVLLRGPEPVHEAEAIVDALLRLKAHLASHPAAPMAGGMEEIERAVKEYGGACAEATTAHDGEVYAALGKVMDTIHTALASQAGRVDWQPIETAPKDGRPVDLWAFWPENKRWRRSPDAEWAGSEWRLYGFTELQYLYRPKITHWMPLPAAPLPDHGSKTEGY